MSSTGDNATKARRPHDAKASRAALLEAARELFRERGYERATTREIGERAGVDPALIVRYFDSKEGLFIAAIAEMEASDTAFDVEPQAFVAFLLEYWEERGHNPLSRALASPVLTPDVRRQVSAVVGELLVSREAAELDRRGAAAPRLRAELLVALAVGVAMTRANGTLETLAATSREDVMATLAPLVDALESA
ncbi:MAG TPA: TetR family transcriptional regulator [Solirubrobacterales bacterium]|jgi:AcrR family transcriptional regulator|nr:TetR family transcriptional regulator [Solirubrobacterales bacterium]